MMKHPSHKDTTPLISIIMGSQSDWETMQNCCPILQKLQIPYEVRIVSAHRTPDRLAQFSKEAEKRGIQVVIAGAGGAAHLPGMCAAWTTLPVLGVPVQSRALKGMDSLLSIVQMPGGVPVGTLAIGASGAKNAALLAASILALNDPLLKENLRKMRDQQTQSVAQYPS